jgi:beta-fructofuranosidase
MWECPVLLRFDGRCALFVCPHPEAKYIYWITGEWEDGLLHEHRRGQLDVGPYAYAAQCLHDPVHDRHLLWTWIKEGRTAEAQRSAGWSGVLSLPKECSLDAQGDLVVKPAAELNSLRTEGQRVESERFTPSSRNPLAGFWGDCLEVEVELSFDEPTIFDMNVRVSPDQAEWTTITYDSVEETLTVDGGRSSLDPDVDHMTISGPLGPDNRGVVWFRVFLDRSVLEVFAADRVCLTHRLYPKRADSSGLSFMVKEGSAIVHRLSVWKLASVWRDRVNNGAAAESCA